jgi:hypothetical protein
MHCCAAAGTERDVGKWTPTERRPITTSLSTRPIRGAALRGMPFTRGVASLGPSLERHA